MVLSRRIESSSSSSLSMILLLMQRILFFLRVPWKYLHTTLTLNRQKYPSPSSKIISLSTNCTNDESLWLPWVIRDFFFSALISFRWKPLQHNRITFSENPMNTLWFLIWMKTYLLKETIHHTKVTMTPKGVIIMLLLLIPQREDHLYNRTEISTINWEFYKERAKDLFVPWLEEGTEYPSTLPLAPEKLIDWQQQQRLLLPLRC